MVPAAGVEPATFRSGGERSNPLSYAGLSLGKITLATKKHKRYRRRKAVNTEIYFHVVCEYADPCLR